MFRPANRRHGDRRRRRGLAATGLAGRLRRPGPSFCRPGPAAFILLLIALPLLASAQPPPETPRTRPTTPVTPAQPGGGQVVPVVPGRQGPPEAPGQAPGGPPVPSAPRPGQPLPPSLEQAHVTWEEGEFNPPYINARGVTIELGEYTLTAGHAEGSFDEEIALTGNPTLTYRGQVVTGEAIRFVPRTRAWSVENLHTALTPDFLRGQILSPLYLSGASISGRQRSNPVYGEDVSATTCDKPRPDYLIHAAEIKVEPGKRIILHRTAFDLWGHRILTLPTLIIPLDRSPRQLRITHPPQVGRSVDEGWFVKSVFNWVATHGVPGLFRLDLMEKKGVGTGIDLDWNTAKALGALALYAIPTSGFAKNVTARLNQRQNLGGGQAVTLDNDYQSQSYLGLPQTTTFNTRFGFTRAVLGSNTTLTAARQASDSTNYLSRSYTASLAQTLQLGHALNVNFNTDYSRYSTSSSGFGSLAGFSQVTEQLSGRLTAEHRASNYLLQLNANHNVPMGHGTSTFSGLERLPEVNLLNYRFTQGFLSRIPADLQFSAGQYSEGGAVSLGTRSRISTERVLAGFDLSDTRFALTRSTDLRMSGGFQQFMYGDGYAQYLVRNNTTLTQRWGRHSGVNIAYTYQRPEGGTPFRFDQQGQYHTLNADVGFLDDRRVQLTARVGYDLAQQSFGGVSQPWQTLSANLLVRPLNWMRMRHLFTFDPNSGRLTTVTSDYRVRGGRDLALDAVTRYDPQRHKFGSINGYFDVPIGRDWRVIALLRYNGYLNQFESRNLQIVRDLHCMEASITYIDNPFGFRTDRQVYFQLRIKAFPVFQRFGIGQFGQPIDTSIGEVY